MHIPIPVRKRLLDQLDDGASLTVVHAPAGSGKTTLLRAWTHEHTDQGRPALWVNLTPRTRLTQQVRDAVSAAVTETGVLEGLTGKRAETLRDQGDDMPAQEALGTLFSTVPGLVLVIDGAEHVTEDPDVMWDELLTLAANHPRSRVVLTTRWLPTQRAEVLALDPTVDLVDAEMLALTPDEVAATVAAAAVVAPPLTEELLRETGGHPRTLMAALLAAAEDPGTAATTWRRLIRVHTLADLDRIGIRHLVEATAAVPLTDVPLTAELTGTTEEAARAALAHAEAHGYGRWRTSAADRPVFELTTAAREAVGTGAAPVDADSLVTWLVEHDELGHALDLSLRSGLLGRATSLYRRLLVLRPFDFTSSFDGTLRTVPAAELRRHPMLAVARGVALLANPATQQEADAYFEPIARRDPRQVSEASPDDELMDLTAQSVVLGVLGRPGPSAEAAVEAARRLDGPEFARQVDPQILTPLSCILSQCLMDAGHVRAAERLISRGSAVAAPELVHYTALYGRAWYGLDGRMTEARAMHARVGQGMDTPGAEAAGVSWGPRTRAVEGLGAALLHLDRWELDAAEQQVEEEQSPRWDPSRAWREWVRLHVALGRGTHDRAVRAASTALEEAGPQQPSLARAALANVVAICWLATGSVARAKQAVAAAPEHPGQTAPARLLIEMSSVGADAALHLAGQLRDEAGHTVRSRAAVEAVAAAAALRTDGAELAGQLLGASAALHAEHGCRSHLLYLSASDLAALHELAHSEESVTALEYLGDSWCHTQLAESTPSVALTTRERAVLEALAAHRSRADLAHALHVSENTIKSQLRSIYRKLGVTQRGEAINRALELDLLQKRRTSAP